MLKRRPIHTIGVLVESVQKDSYYGVVTVGDVVWFVSTYLLKKARPVDRC